MATLRHTSAKFCGNWDGKTRRRESGPRPAALDADNHLLDIDAASSDFRKLIQHAVCVDVDRLLRAGCVRDHAHCRRLRPSGSSAPANCKARVIGN